MPARLNSHLEPQNTTPRQANVNPSLPGPVGVLPVDARNTPKPEDTTVDNNTDCDEDGGTDGDCEENSLKLHPTKLS